MLLSLSCVIVFARATFVLKLSVLLFGNTKSQRMNHYRSNEPSERYGLSC